MTEGTGTPRSEDAIDTYLRGVVRASVMPPRPGHSHTRKRKTPALGRSQGRIKAVLRRRLET
jgi:hypothetical protein